MEEKMALTEETQNASELEDMNTLLRMKKYYRKDRQAKIQHLVRCIIAARKSFIPYSSTSQRQSLRISIVLALQQVLFGREIPLKN